MERSYPVYLSQPDTIAVLETGKAWYLRRRHPGEEPSYQLRRSQWAPATRKRGKCQERRKRRVLPVPRKQRPICEGVALCLDENHLRSSRVTFLRLYPPSRRLADDWRKIAITLIDSPKVQVRGSHYHWHVGLVGALTRSTPRSSQA